MSANVGGGGGVRGVRGVQVCCHHCWAALMSSIFGSESVARSGFIRVFVAEVFSAVAAVLVGTKLLQHQRSLSLATTFWTPESRP